MIRKVFMEQTLHIKSLKTKNKKLEIADKHSYLGQRRHLCSIVPKTNFYASKPQTTN